MARQGVATSRSRSLDVSSAPGLWLEGAPHTLTYFDGQGAFRQRTPFQLLLGVKKKTAPVIEAGQIVMEGFVNIRLRPWLRRLITRLIAIIPALITVGVVTVGVVTVGVGTGSCAPAGRTVAPMQTTNATATNHHR